MRILTTILILGLGLLTPPAPGQQKKAPNPAFRPVVDQPGLPRVLLIGDSISIGYTVDVQELLKGKANVHRISQNSGPTILGLEKIDQWLGDGHWDAIHFNWGLHDLKFMENGKRQVPLEQYRANLDKLTARLQKTGAKLIWAATTPVPAAEVSPPRKDSDVVAYNQAAAEIMKKRGVAVDDLYSFALPRLAKIQQPANVHFSREGSAELAKVVAASISQAVK